MIALQIDGDTIINLIEVDNLDVMQNIIESINGAEIGDKIIEGKLLKSKKIIIVPESVEPLQLDEALIELGFYDAIYAYVDQASNIEKAKFRRARNMYRNDPFLVNGAKALGLTDAEIDAVFILAATK